MARALIVGCGCRGTALAAGLSAEGHAVRGTSRTPAGVARIEAAGIEAVRADPDRVATLMPALEGVSVLCWLLGRAHGGAAAVAALHCERLQMLFAKLVDSPVRGVLYEPAAVPGPARERGLAVVAHARATWSIPVAEVAGDAPHDQWLAEARDAVGTLLARPASHR